MTTWIELYRIINQLSEMKKNRWFWGLNSKCKYIDIRIDLRDEMCILKDRYGNHITLDELSFQCKTESSLVA